MPEISGIAHIQLCVSDMSRSYPFYTRLLSSMGMKAIIDDENYVYYVGAKTGVAIVPASEDLKQTGFRQGSVGLHHVCFRAKSNKDVDEMCDLAKQLNAKIIRQPQISQFAPGYYSTLFEDPDGIRIEVNHVPGKGLLAD